MPAGISNEIYEFVKEVVYKLLPSEKDSEDITYNVFKKIDERADLLKKYRALGKTDVATLHKQMGKAVKEIDGRENLEENDNPVPLKNITLTSYTRFKPKA